MKKILVVFGTRPEAIKMCPLVKELEKRQEFDVKVCVTGQHREMLKQVLDVFTINPDFDMDIMTSNQTLFDITCRILEKSKIILSDFDPDLVLVHGDTTTTYAMALSCFYLNIKIGHVEAGLRTYDINSPFPEEFNRQSVSLIADYHFAPTEKAKINLLREGKENNKIFVTGNTAIDALKYTINNEYESDITNWAKNSKLILITAHRRENLGSPMRNMFTAIKKIMEEFPDLKAVYPMHSNPKIREIAVQYFGTSERFKLIEPLDVLNFHNLMNHAYLILTDSGGIQEEAPSLGKPVLVMRDSTERPEGVEAGTLKLVGTDESKIYETFKFLIENEDEYKKMCDISNPYGDGNSCKYIADILNELLT